MQLKNIINLSRIFIRENNNTFKFIDFKNKRINKKSGMFWIFVILFFGIFYCSQEVVKYFVKIGKPEIVLNGYFLFLQILIIIQTIMLCINIFYFSKEMENILPLPFKPIEILISKFNTIMFIVYCTEFLLALVPFIIYGIYTDMGILFYINLIFSLIIFPIFSVLIVSIIMMFLMRTIKFFRNKDLMQILISFLLIFVLMIFVSISAKYIFNNESLFEDKEKAAIILNNINEKIIGINNYFIIINPITNLLQEKNILNILIYFLELIFINFITFIIFYFLGNKLYLKQLLKNNFYIKNKNNKIINFNKKFKKNKINISYIKKEFKLLIRNPLFFIQNIYPVCLWTIMCSILIIVLTPKVIQIMQLEQYKEMAQNLKFDFEAICLILGLTQIIGLFNYTSVTSISREGQNAYVMKYLPISLYKQFIYKNMPQVIINIFCSIIILSVIHFSISVIELKYIFSIFIFSVILFFINSLVLSLIDLINPKLNWKGEYEILKNNTNKLLQYVLIIFNIIFLYYFDKIFIKYDLDKSLIIFGIILIILFVIINLIIYKCKNKLFKKIN